MFNYDKTKTLQVNPVFNTDAYKVSHKKFETEGTQFIQANFTPRSFRLFPIQIEKCVVFGTQRMVRKLVSIWNQNFFSRPKAEVMAEIEYTFGPYLGMKEDALQHFGELYDLGYLPLTIKGLPEGSRVNARIPVLTIENTDINFSWLVTYLETWISTEMWLPMTSATTVYEFRKLVNEWAEKTTGTTTGTEFQLHDFSYRGMGPDEAAASGLGFLLSSFGTDTIPALVESEWYYDARMDKELVAGSVPATEHSVTCVGIEVNGELETMRKWITESYPTGIVSIVADTLDFFKVITEYATALKDDIMNRQVNEIGLAKVVFRPDCYDEETKVLTNSGWKYFKDLTDNDLVAQVEDGEYSFVKPEKIIAQEYHGVMHHFKDYHGKVDLLVTPNHRMILEQEGKERVVFAEKLGKTGHHKQKMMRGARAKTTTSGITPIERLKVAFQADGSYCTDTTSSIRFSFSKERKIERMRDLLDDCGLEYKVYTLSDGKSEFNIKVDANNFSKNFEWVDTGNLCGLWCEGFIDELKHWDSSIRSEDRFKFDTSNKEVISIIEYIAMSAGYGIFITKTQDNRSEKFSEVYTAHIMTNNKIGGQSWVNEKIEDYSGKVYCVKVPSGKIIVKRNKCTMVCGNSGDPVKILTGYTPQEFDYDGVNYYCKDTGNRLSEPEVRGAVECLWEIFGGTTTEQGYKVMNERVGLIYGDSITYDRAKEIMRRLADKGFASTNCVFGVGSYTMRYVTRDSLGSAMKVTWAMVDGEQYAVSKDPKTDSGIKKSARGYVSVVEQDGEYVLIESEDKYDTPVNDAFTPVLMDGTLLGETTFDEIRNRLWS